jgi:HSP20 family protein
MDERDPRTWMWLQACELLARADRLHRQFFQLGASHAPRPIWEPPADIFESEHEIVILVALPGVADDQLEVTFDSRMLIVAGERRLPLEARGAKIQRLEIPYGRFERRVRLPAARLEVTRRELVNGCLALSLRKLS